MQEASHGRAPAVATGIKRVHPENLVFTYQGDGDLAAIGTAETIHSAARAENITIIFVNNTIYGDDGRSDGANLFSESGYANYAVRQKSRKSGIPDTSQ